MSEHPERIAAKEALAYAHETYDRLDARIGKAVHDLHDVMGKHPLTYQEEIEARREPCGGPERGGPAGGCAGR